MNEYKDITEYFGEDVMVGLDVAKGADHTVICRGDYGTHEEVHHEKLTEAVKRVSSTFERFALSARESSEAMAMLHGGRQFGKCSLRQWYAMYVDHRNSYFSRVNRNTRFGKSKVFNRMVKLNMGCK